jgi:Rrf2 family protein
MRLGTRAKYTLRLMMGIGRLAAAKNKPVSLGDVSRHSGISRRYLDQLVVSLKNADLLRGRTGRGGGYTLSRPPETIKVGEIIEAAIGPISVSDCVNKPDTCIQSELCQCRMLWQLINLRIIEVLNEYSLADLLDPSWAGVVQRELETVMSRHAEGARPTWSEARRQAARLHT